MSRHVRRDRAIDSDTANSMYYGEKFNALTHLVGAVLALAGTVVLIVLAALGGDPWKVVSISIYGVTFGGAKWQDLRCYRPRHPLIQLLRRRPSIPWSAS